MRRSAISVLCALLLAFSPASGDELEERAEKLEGQIMAPCCMTNTVDMHESGVSHQIRREIREMLADGRTEAEILDHYVVEYGPQILAVPRAQGFSLMTYLFPVLFLVLAGAGLVFAMRRWRATDRETEAAPVPEQPAADDPYAERLKRELEKYD